MKSEVRLKRKIFGFEHGNFSPSLQTREQFLAQIEKAKKELGESVKTIFAPSVEFTNTVAEFGQNDDIFAPWLIRTKIKADAGITEKPGVAIAFFNADCPIICLHQDEKLAVIHGGYRCLMRENRDEPGILEVTAQDFDSAKTKAF
ncbi:MAG: laccase domain-containing protein, partial [Patescibacteria group bacterium]